MEFISSTILQTEDLHIYQKYAPLQVFSKIFAQICSYLYGVFRNFTNICFPKNLLVAPASCCKVLKIFISLKVTIYIYAGPQIMVWENLRCLVFWMET